MKKLLFAVLLCSFVSEMAFAKWSRSAARASGTQTGNQMGSQLSGDAQKNNTVDQTQQETIQEASVDNVNNGQKGQSTAIIMYGALGAAAATKISICSGSGFTGYAACISGAILLGMATQAKKSADSFNGPIGASWNNVCQYSSGGCSSMPNPYKAAVDHNKNQDALKKAQALANSNGITVDANSGIVKLSDGKEINVNDPASIGAALGAEGSNDLMNSVKNIEQQALKKVEQLQPASLGDAYGLGGAASILAGVGYDEESDPAASALGVNSGTRIPAQVTGLTKNFNGEPVGVAGDNLFGIMSRRYRLKSNQKTFFGPEANQ